MGTERVWVDDRNTIFRRGLVSCLTEASFDIVGESAAFQPKPDVSKTNVLVFDAAPGDIGRLARHFRGTGVKLVAIARPPAEDVTIEAVEAGLSGVLARDDLMPEALIACLRGVLHGNDVLPAGVLSRLVDGGRNGRRTSSLAVGALTSRETDVLRLLADGNDTRHIASHLSYSERTVKNIMHDLMVRMGCRTRAQAVAVAARRGLI